MIKFYFNLAPNPTKVALCLEEMGLKYEIVPVDTFIARAPQGPDSKPIFEERLTGVVVRSHGNLAQAWATYTARFGEPGNVATWEGIDAFTLLRHDGTWRIVSLSYTDK